MAYAPVNELMRVLGKERPTQAELEAGDRVLEAAAEEIDWELGYTVENPLPTPSPPLIVEVNLERAVEHWRQGYSPFGAIALQGFDVPVLASRDTWYRHARKLAPLKQQWGVA